jgi:hypothetical protein
MPGIMVRTFVVDLVAIRYALQNKCIAAMGAPLASHPGEGNRTRPRYMALWEESTAVTASTPGSGIWTERRSCTA